VKIFGTNNISIEYVDGTDLYESEDLDYVEIEDVQRSSGINILSSMALKAVAKVDGKIVGCLWDSYYASEDEYSFDVAVLPEYQRQGIGKMLIDAGINTFQAEYIDMNPDAKLRLNVVNHDLVNYLVSIGFIVKERIGDHVIMDYGV
jgi:ribosomal protein S18 acetylase RimI-like enzyme